MQLDTMLTLDEYARLAARDGQRLELNRGLLVRQPHPSTQHATVTARIYDVLRDYAARAGGRAVLDMRFVLQEEPPTIRGPDLAYVGEQQTTERTAGSVVRGAPRLAVEILAASTDGTRAERIEKAFEYLDAGATTVWLVDLGARTVAAYEAGVDPTVYHRFDRIRGAAALPGFDCPVATFFD